MIDEILSKYRYWDCIVYAVNISRFTDDAIVQLQLQVNDAESGDVEVVNFEFSGVTVFKMDLGFVGYCPAVAMVKTADGVVFDLDGTDEGYGAFENPDSKAIIKAKQVAVLGGVK